MDDLTLMPRGVRDKLDRVGIKLHLREWSLLTLDERRWLVDAPCASDADMARYAAELDDLDAALHRQERRATRGAGSVMKSVVRIANASGYWGDDPEALLRQVSGGPLDYVTMDFLAEITMVILQRQRARDPKRGLRLRLHRAPRARAAGDRRARHDGDRQRRRHQPGRMRGGGRRRCVATPACRCRSASSAATTCCRGSTPCDAAGAAARSHGRRAPLRRDRGRVVAANAYISARPVVEALRGGARIIVTGRTTDAALILAPLVHEFGWAWDDWDRLAAGIAAGHILECGAQATGGNFTDWQRVPSMLDIGYPIAEVQPDGDVRRHQAPQHRRHRQRRARSPSSCSTRSAIRAPTRRPT